MVSADCTEQQALAQARHCAEIAAQLEGKTIVKELYVKGKLVNIVVK